MKCQESPRKYKERIYIYYYYVFISTRANKNPRTGTSRCVFPGREHTEEVPPAALLGLFVEVLPLPFQGFTCTVCGRYLWRKMISIFNGIKLEYCKTV
jgi:hypothetical protein